MGGLRETYRCAGMNSGTRVLVEIWTRLGSSLRSPAEGEGNEGFPPPPDKDLESFQERCRLRRSWGYFGELGSNPAWRGRVGTTIPPGLGIWEASEVQARSGRGAEAGEQGRYPLPSIDPSTGVCTGRTPSHSLEGVGSLAKNSHECCDRKNGTQRRATVGQRGHGRRCTSS